MSLNEQIYDFVIRKEGKKHRCFLCKKSKSNPYRSIKFFFVAGCVV